MRENIFLKGISLGDGEVIGDNIPVKILYESVTTPYNMTFAEIQKFIDASHIQLESQLITEATVLNEGSVVDKLRAIWKAIADWFKKIYGKISTFIKGLFKKKAEDSGKPATSEGAESSNDEPATSKGTDDEPETAEDDKSEDNEKETKFSKAVGGSTYTKTFKRRGTLSIDSNVSIRYMKIDLYQAIVDCRYPGSFLPIQPRDISDSGKILKLYDGAVKSKGFIVDYLVNKYNLKGYYNSIESVMKGINNISDSFTATYKLSEIGPGSKARTSIINDINKKMRNIEKELKDKDGLDSTATIPDYVDEDLAKKITTILNTYKDYNMTFFKIVAEACRQTKISMSDARKYNLIK